MVFKAAPEEFGFAYTTIELEQTTDICRGS